MSVLFKTYSTYLAKKMRENDEANFKNLKHIDKAYWRSKIHQ